MRIYLATSNKFRTFVSVKQQVKDVTEALAGLLSGLKGIRRTIAPQHAEICAPNRNVDRMLKENRELRVRLEIHEKPPGTLATAVRRHPKNPC